MRNKKILGLRFLVLVTSSLLRGSDQLAQKVTIFNETNHDISGKILFKGQLRICPPRAFTLKNDESVKHEIPLGCCLEGIELSVVSEKAKENERRLTLKLPKEFGIDHKLFRRDKDRPRYASRECKSVRIPAYSGVKHKKKIGGYEDIEQTLSPDFEFIVKEQEGRLVIEAGFELDELTCWAKGESGLTERHLCPKGCPCPDGWVTIQRIEEEEVKK